MVLSGDSNDPDRGSLIYYGKEPYQYISLFLFINISYLWRYFYRKKQKAVAEDTGEL